MKKIIGILSIFVTLTGCVTTGGTITTDKDVATGRTDKRPNCSYGFSSGLRGTNAYTYLPRFYKETRREAELGIPVKEGSILFYGQYAETEMVAIADETIENRDRSPLTPSWKWPQNTEQKVAGLVTFDDKNWWYLINADNTGYSYGYWTSDQSGMLCGNVLSWDANRLTTLKGMSEIYQTKPVRFEGRAKQGIPPLSVSISVASVTGATAKLEISAMKDGRSLHTSIITVDLLGGEFTAGKVRFATERKSGQIYLKSVSVPEQISSWLAFDLKIR